MRLSAYFLPLLRENPSEAQIVSHRLMLRAGMVRQSSAGIYSWLPLGFRVMRGREFLMKDNYSFDLDAKGAKHSYNKMFVAYLRTFARMGLKAIPMRADTGPIGGDLSHEFIILAETGESQVFCDRAWLDADILANEVDYAGDLEPFFGKWTTLYAATDEKHDPNAFPPAPLVPAPGIDAGHLFS